MTKQARVKWLEDNLAYLYGNGGIADPGPYIPSAPRNLVATEAGAGEYDLTWDVPLSDGDDAIIEYNVYQNGVLLDTVAAPATNLDGVSAAVDDEFYVRAVNSIGEGPRSNTETIHDDIGPGTGEGMFGSLLGAMFGRMFGRNPA